MQNVRRQNKCAAEAIALIADRKVDVDQLVNHRFALTETAKAFDLVSRYGDGVIKALIEV